MRFSYFIRFCPQLFSIHNAARTALFATFITGFSAHQPALAGPRETMLRGQAQTSVTITETQKANWKVDQNTTPFQAPLIVPLGQGGTVSFNASVTKTLETLQTDSGPILGQFCLTNTGFFDTIGLTLEIALDSSSGASSQEIARQRLPFTGELRSGESACYPYRFEVPINPSFTYRTRSFAWIRNYSGHWGQAWGISVTTPVEITLVKTELDGSATYEDQILCPSGFSCQAIQPLQAQQIISDSTTLAFLIGLTNQNASCGKNLPLVNQLSLTPLPSGSPISVATPVQVYTGTCRP